MRPRLHRRRCRSLLLGAALALGAQSASAATIESLVLTLEPGNSSNVFEDFPSISRLRQSSASVLVNTASNFSTRYAMVVGTDIGNAATQTISHTANYTITLSVLATLGEIWQLDIATSWAGALTLVNDGSGPATVTLDALTGTAGGAGVMAGSLSLAAVGTLSSNSGGNLAFLGNSTAAIVATGTGAIQTVTLNFTWNSSSTSTRGTSGSNRGDEGALRMGIDTAMSSYTADNYPGIGGRILANDGHFVSGAIITIAPEPHAIGLLLIGTAGLAVLGRRRAP
jgi:hypothetical protein